MQRSSVCNRAIAGSAGKQDWRCAGNWRGNKQNLIGTVACKSTEAWTDKDLKYF